VPSPIWKGQSTNCRVDDELLPEAQNTLVRQGNDIVSAIRNDRMNDKLWNVSPIYR
jgi:hypothetical protein